MKQFRQLVIKNLSERKLIKFLQQIGRQDLVDIAYADKGIPNFVKSMGSKEVIAHLMKSLKNVTLFGEYELTEKEAKHYLRVLIKKRYLFQLDSGDTKTKVVTVIEEINECDPNLIP